MKKLTVEERYSTPSKDCILWPIMKIDENHGYNDWKIITLESTKQNDRKQNRTAVLRSLREMGRTLGDDVEVERFGACVTEDRNYDYFLFKITGEAEEVNEDATLDPGDGREVKVFAGDSFCRGIWMDRLHGAQHWWTMTAQPCIVRLQEVVYPNLPLLAMSDSNPLH